MFFFLPFLSNSVNQRKKDKETAAKQRGETRKINRLKQEMERVAAKRREQQELEELKRQFQPDYSPSERWDTNAITPGTAFMELLSISEVVCFG